MTTEPLPVPRLNDGLTYLAERSFRDFVPGAWAVLEPKTPFLPNWHIDLICEHLTAVLLGQCTRLVINIPPRYMKSLLVTVMWPVWAWILQGHLRWLFASYSLGLSVKHNVDRRTIIQSPWYQARWGGHYQLSEDQNVKHEFTNTLRGAMTALSVGGGTGTGKGADVIVIDDPTNPKEAYSDAERLAANTYYDQTLSTRLNDKQRGAIVLVMQRLHQEDLTGHVLGQERWEHVNLPGEGKPGRVVVTLPLSKQTIVRTEGDALWPAREPAALFPTIKRRLGSAGFAAQYQQEPSPAEGGIFKRAWWQWYRELPPRFDRVIASWDMAFKDSRDSSFVCGQVWGAWGARRFLLYEKRARLDFVGSCRAVKAVRDLYPQAVPILVEDKANGPAVIALLQQQVPGLLAVEPDGSKLARAHATSPYVEAGNVFLPTPEIAPWIAGPQAEDGVSWIEEVSLFPAAAHNDRVDAMTQALRYLGVNIVTAEDFAFAGVGPGPGRPEQLDAVIGGAQAASSLSW